jgi:hypothetical protein
MSGHVAAADCERSRPGLVAQPINTVSSLAFVAAGVPLARDRRRAVRAVGWAAVATGAGSVLFHGPGGTVGRYLHDASLIALLGLMAVDDAGRVRGRELPAGVVAVVAAAAAVGAHPELSDVAQPVAGGLAVAAGVARSAVVRDGVRPLAGLAALGAGGLLHALGRTGEPLCDPDSWAQPHAAWHALAAVGVLLRHAA